jgi:membrane protease YdiL (CAAX protease family)
LSGYQDILADAGLLVWLIGAVVLLGYLGFFSPKPLRTAPPREGYVSLPVVGGVIVLYYVVLIASLQVAVGTGLVPRDLFEPATQGAATATAAATKAAEKPDQFVAGSAIDGAAKVLSVLVLVLVLPRLFKEGAKGWGFSARQILGGVLKGLLGFAIIYPVLISGTLGLDWIYSLYRYQMTDHPAILVMKEHPSLWRDVLLCLTAALVAPVAEEVFFRGILQTALIQQGWGLLFPQALPGVGAAGGRYMPTAGHRWAAIVIASAAFAAMHQADQMAIIFLLSLGLGYVYERTGNLWAAIFLHMAFNGTELVTFIATRGG